MRDLLSSTDRHRETFSSPSLSLSFFRPLFLFLPPLCLLKRSAATPLLARHPACNPPPVVVSSKITNHFGDGPLVRVTLRLSPVRQLKSPPLRLLHRGVPNANTLSLSLSLSLSFSHWEYLEFFASCGDFIFDEESPRSAAYNLQTEPRLT